MKVLWIKDNNIGHEKQVKILLDELNKNVDLDIDDLLGRLQVEPFQAKLRLG